MGASEGEAPVVVSVIGDHQREGEISFRRHGGFQDGNREARFNPHGGRFWEHSIAFHVPITKTQ